MSAKKSKFSPLPFISGAVVRPHVGSNPGRKSSSAENAEYIC